MHHEHKLMFYTFWFRFSNFNLGTGQLFDFGLFEGGISIEILDLIASGSAPFACFKVSP